MNRVAPHLAGVALVAVVAALAEGSAALCGACMVLFLGSGRWAVRNRHGAVEQAWSAAATRSTRTTGPGPASTASVVRSLGRVEARELVLSPWFTVGLGFCTVMVISFAPSYDGHESWWEIVQDLPFLAHPLVGMTVLAAHRNATRAQRDGATEMLATTPASDTRRFGVLAGAWVPVVALTVFSIAYIAVVSATTAVDGRFGAAAVPTVLSASVMGAGGVALGVALSRWVRVALAPVVAVAAVGFVSLQLGEGAPGEHRPRMLLSTFGTSLPDDAPELAAGRAWLHLAWLVTITVFTAVVAVAGRRHGQRPRRPIAPAGTEPVAELGAAR